MDGVKCFFDIFNRAEKVVSSPAPCKQSKTNAKKNPYGRCIAVRDKWR